ncbi:Afadin and alpha-actinin-binding-domain-containing protein [Pilobolus umbonatus]|nr:Afadin and alpha-actinin-binding-domain-containing protein [Pilobolus umbonatus]
MNAVDKISVDDSSDIGDDVCTPDSIDSSSNHLNMLLTSYGYPVPLIFQSTDTADNCKIINCMFNILSDRQKDAMEKEQMLMTIHKLKKDNADIETELKISRRECSQLKTQCAGLQSKLDNSEGKAKKQAAQMNKLKEEIGKMKNNMQYMKAQYMHETKKHQQDMSKTQDRLLKVMNNHYKMNVATITMNSYPESTNDEEGDKMMEMRTLYNDLLTQSTERQKQIELENTDLRTCLMKIYTGVRNLLVDQIRLYDDTFPQFKRNDLHPEVARLQLPIDCGAKEAIEDVHALIMRLREEWENQTSQKVAEYTEDDIAEKDDTIISLQQAVEDLIEALEQTKYEYEEKIKIYKKFEEGGFYDVVLPSLDESKYASDSDTSQVIINYDAARTKALQQQQQVTQSAIELGKERTRLEAERWAFEEMKRELEMSNIINLIDIEEVNNSTHSQREKEVVEMATPTQPDRVRKRFRSWLGSPSTR